MISIRPCSVPVFASKEHSGGGGDSLPSPGDDSHPAATNSVAKSIITSTRASGHPEYHTTGHPGTFPIVKFTFKIHIFTLVTFREGRKSATDVYAAAALGKLDFGRTSCCSYGRSIAIDY